MNAPARKSARSRWLAGLAVLALALMISLMLLLSEGGCTPAVAFDRPIVEEAPAERSAQDLERLPETSGSATSTRITRPQRGEAAIALAPVRGLVADDSTRELIPYVEVELFQEQRNDRIAVGADGRFASSIDFATGIVHAVVRDSGEEVGRAQIEHDGVRGTSEWRVEVPIGPTVPIASIDDGPIRVDAWQVRIVESALKEGIAGEIDVSKDQLALRAPSVVQPDRAWSWRTLRPGDRPWLRYPRREHDPVAGVRATLVLRDDVANRKGTAALRKTVGVQPAAIVETRAFAKARIRILREKGFEELPMRALLYDTRDLPLEGQPGAPVFDELAVGPKGEVEFPDLDGGTKHLVAWSREERVDRYLVVEAGPSEFVETRARRVDRQAKPTLARSMQSSSLLESEARWLHLVASLVAAEGKMIGQVSSGAFDDIAWEMLGSHSLEGFEISAVMSWPSGTIPRRSSDSARYRFEAPWNAGMVSVALGPVGDVFPAELGATETSMFLLPPELVFSWSAWAEDKQPLFGDSTAFVKDAKGVRQASLEFEPGFGAQIFIRAGEPDATRSGVEANARKQFARSAQSRKRSGSRDKERNQDRVIAAMLALPPVPGVGLQVEGLESAVSDAQGELRLRQPIAPTRLTLVADGWRARSMDHLPGSGCRYVVWMGRDP